MPLTLPEGRSIPDAERVTFKPQPHQTAEPRRLCDVSHLLADL